MFDFLKNKEEKSQDVKALRHQLVNFIKEQLKKAEGGEGGSIKGLQLFLAPAADEKHLYEAAIYIESESRFKEEEVQKIADDYAIDLPAQWTMEICFAETLPAAAIRSSSLPVALHISTKKQAAINRPTAAKIRVLNGEAEQKEYTIDSTTGNICIGREKEIRTADGFYRENFIAFPAASQHESNKYISRQHAHIEWNKEEGCFYLFADEGGIPPKNKIKVRLKDGALIKLQSTHVGHHLSDGDQIILGESALLDFCYLQQD